MVFFCLQSKIDFGNDFQCVSEYWLALSMPLSGHAMIGSGTGYIRIPVGVALDRGCRGHLLTVEEETLELWTKVGASPSPRGAGEANCVSLGIEGIAQGKRLRPSNPSIRERLS